MRYILYAHTKIVVESGILFTYFVCMSESQTCANYLGDYHLNSKKGVDRLKKVVDRLGCWGQGVVENVEVLGYHISILSSQNRPPIQFLTVLLFSP
jgi:hypothetical protein